eukprot:TRINITY_DN107403_c0_g1_i1.p1 TRINITY_DN107403_c0_g1~~TRINITY_DN107403_c0_g1_i1.p1  ORF type:complete len:247 (-),score=39.14 TRINITY_DN107403_c0_g1_i1:20-700(-)
MASPPPLTEEQAQALLEKKKTFATEQGKPDDACQNIKCRCAECTCGAACTCNISPAVTCDPCKEFKAAVAMKTNAARQEAARAFYDDKLAASLTGVPVISVAELRSLAGDRLVVDCRSQEEQTVSTIAGAVSKADFEADQEKLGQGKHIVTFCTIGGRGGKYTQELLERPEASRVWSSVRSLDLGVVGWCHEGGTLVDSEGKPTTKVHAHTEKMMALFPVNCEVTV